MKKIKGASGTTHLLHTADVSGWNDGRRALQKLGELLNHNKKNQKQKDLDKPRNEDRGAFQRNFAADAKKVYHGFDVSSFEEINIVNISNASISLKSLKLLLSNGEVQFQMFLHERLIGSTKSIDAPVKESNYKSPRTTNDAVKAEKKKLIYAPAILNKIREFLRVRIEQANQLFKPELFDVAQSIAEMKIHSIIVANLIY